MQNTSSMTRIWYETVLTSYFSSAAEAMKTAGTIMLTAALLLSDGTSTAYYLRGTGIDEDLSMDKARVATVQVRYLRRHVDPSFPGPSSTVNTVNMSEDHAKVNNTKSSHAAIDPMGPISTANAPDLALSSPDEMEKTAGDCPTHVEIGISSHRFGSSNLVEFVVHPSERISSAALPFNEIESRGLPVTGPNRARPTERNFWFGSHPSRYRIRPQHFSGVMNRQMGRLPINLPLDLPRARQRQYHYFADV